MGLTERFWSRAIDGGRVPALTAGSRPPRLGSRLSGSLPSSRLDANLLATVATGAIAVVAIRVTVARILGHSGAWGFDFHGGLWPAATALLNGRSPYAPASAHVLFALRTSFVTPPALALPALPLAHLPFGVAVGIWNLVTVLATLAGLWLLGLRDGRLYALALASYPLADTLFTGQTDGLFVLLLAIAWRWRDDRRAGVAVGVLIAFKLLAWPLLIWLAVTRRWRSGVIAIAVAAALLVASWALIDFQGVAQYPRLLAADARAFEAWSASLSLVGLLIHLSIGQTVASALAVAVGFAAGGVVLSRSNRSDAGWFSAAILVGLLISPLLWPHYLLVLLVPLALARKHSVGPWLATIILWVPLASTNYWVRVLITLLAAVAITAWATSRTPESRTQPASRSLLEA